MAAKLITAPAAPAVLLEEAKKNLRLEADDTSLDSIIQLWLMGITDYAEHFMGRAIVDQVWRVQLERFPAEISLPRSPVSAVLSVKYYDASNVLQTLDPARYQLDDVTEPCRVVPSAGATWPSTYARVNAVTVDVTCGYGEDDSTTPPGIKLFLLAKLVEQFDPAVKPEKDGVKSSFLDRMLDRYCIQVF
jgi:uncharacterized phiE125 gp8 family phage protein